MIVNVAGTNRLVNSLKWSGQGEFSNSARQKIWVWNPDRSRGELAGYANDGGGLTYAIVRNAGMLTTFTIIFLYLYSNLTPLGINNQSGVLASAKDKLEDMDVSLIKEGVRLVAIIFRTCLQPNRWTYITSLGTK